MPLPFLFVFKVFKEVMTLKNFIEVTNYDNGMKVLVPVGRIMAVVCDDSGGAFIEMGTDNKATSSGVITAESYDEIKQKIKESEVF